MTYVTIYEDEDYQQMARKMFNHMGVNQAVKIKGFVLDIDGVTPKPKGEAVFEWLVEMDRLYNIGANGRKKKILPNSNGVPVAHAIFRWARIIDNNVPIYTIWRVQ